MTPVQRSLFFPEIFWATRFGKRSPVVPARVCVLLGLPRTTALEFMRFFLVKCRRKEFGAPVGGKLLELCGILYDMIIRSSFEACPVQGVVVK